MKRIIICLISINGFLANDSENLLKNDLFSCTDAPGISIETRDVLTSNLNSLSSYNLHLL